MAIAGGELSESGVVMRTVFDVVLREEGLGMRGVHGWASDVGGETNCAVFRDVPHQERRELEQW